MTATNKTPVTVIGLGSMGHTLASTFLKAGHPLTVWNRTPEKADDLVAAGAARAATPAEAAAASPLVIVCLVDHAVTRESLASAGKAFADRVLVNLTNSTPDQAREIAAWAGENGVTYVDGGIMATPPLIGGPASFLLYSGDREAFDAHRDALAVLGTPHFMGEDPGAAALYDLALLSGMYGMAAGVAHARALVTAHAGPAKAQEFSQTMLLSWIQAMLSVFAGMDAAKMADESPLDMQAPALVNILEASDAEGVPPMLAAHLLSMMKEIVDAGFTDVLPPVIDDLVGRLG
ncbi:NAD(P)-dependent oxidoreductase [Actinomadura kijaniata]|uniref:3-hydroxyisobutyrate dehydrogenase-like beta-hydroxyacid dehydrogenase n=1 Tax=Actinomadura namibiensis TaxID=182080 RepID=A0A7W3LLX0_ACTNM|nr:NAD(P)-binding domain-containing protein [Actinomadura namibiensis]MBA8950542.1 3-hydroxyisobutyrate dehydrogenase-like beta-hydroxyacid dehydrogenase [Actinomadura namibiensis]